jgi:hypothetical protein
MTYYQVYFNKISSKHQINPNKEPNFPPLLATKPLATQDPLANSPATVTFFISGQTQLENTEKHKPNLKNRL